MKAIRSKAVSILCLMAMIITTVISGIPSVNAAASGASSGTSASVFSDTINFGQSGSLTLNLKPTSPTTVRTETNITTGIEIDATALTKPVEGLYLEIEVPTKQTSKNQNDTNNIADGTYLDNFATPAAKTQPIIKSEETIVTNDGKTIKRIYLNKIDNTVRLQLPYVMSFADKTTPSDFKLKPVVRMYSADGTKLSTLEDKTYGVTYPKPWLMKIVAGEETDDQLVYAGASSRTNPSSISEDGASDINYNFKLYQDYRAYRSIIITDKLPTYVDSAGNTRTAKFDPAKNPNWTISADGKTVTLRFDIPTGVRDLRDYIRDNLPAYSNLKLSFPGAKYMNGSNRVNFTNTAEMQGIPFNPGVAEATVGKVAGNEHNFDDDTKRFRLAGDDYNGDGMLGKKGPLTIPFDKNSLAVRELEYAIKLVNKLDRPLTDIEIYEDVQNTGGRLFMTMITGNLVGVGSRANLNLSQLELRGYKADGTYDVIPLTNNGAAWLFKGEVNADSKAKLQSYLDQINQGTLDPANAGAVDPKYKRVGLYLKDFTLAPSANLEFNLKMMFINPFGETYNDRPINNTVKADVNRVNEDGSKTKMDLSGSWNSYFTPFTEKVWLGKETRNQRVGMPNERFTARVGFRLDTLSGARYLKNPTFVDLLPTGVSYDQLTHVDPIVGSKPVQSVEFIKNYNETGRDAVKIVLPSGYVYEYANMSYDIVDLYVNNDVIPSKAENDQLNNNNDVYFYADNWTKGTPADFAGLYNTNNFVKDTLDININGVVDETILKATAKVLGNNVESIQSDKHIRSLEPNTPGGAAVYGRAFTRNTISTDFADVTNTSGLFQYRLSVRNYYNMAMDKILMYDVFPHVGDGRNSAFSNTLQGPLELKIGSTDVSDKYDIYYRTDRYPDRTDKNELNSSAWTKNPGDYTKVKAIKIVGKNGTTLEPYTVLSAYLTMKAPTYDPKLSEAVANNTFSVIYNDEVKLRETDVVSNKLIDKMDVEATKKWVDTEGNEIATPDVNEITVKLFANGEDTGKTAKLTAANNWKAKFTQLRQYTVVQNNDGTTTKTPIVYTVKEANQNGNNKVTYSGKTYDVTANSVQVNPASPTEQLGITITNTMEQEKVEVSGTKTWDDNFNQDGKRPTSIKVNLLANGSKVQEKTVNADSNWTYTFANLPKYKSGQEITYTVTEEAVDGYTATINGYDISNKHKPEYIDIPVEKVWVNDNSVISSRPNKIHVKLYANDEMIEERDIKAADNWKHTFANLPKYKGGKEIKYAIKEDAVGGYTTKVTGDSAGFVITNTYEPEKPNVPKTPDKPKKTGLPKTGDSAILVFYAGALLFALAGLALLIRMRKKISE